MVMPLITPPMRALYAETVARALAEDIGYGDLTTEATVAPDASGSAVIVAKEPLILAGTFLAREAFAWVEPHIILTEVREEGSEVSAGDVVMKIHGRLRGILKAERVALNFLQRLCGVATLTRRFVKELSGTTCRLVDTRKTTPGLRLLQKYAVRVGGGYNHRYGLSDGILIKNNHIAACGSVKAAVSLARSRAPHTLKIEIEVSGLGALREAIEAGADVVLLDNMEPAALREAVDLARGLKPGITLEASGGISLQNIRAVAQTGVDIVSVGALTHSARACDLSLRVT
jgi:nicotinate-nucleotide pyrophosphorylase (carboxylating)